MRENRGKKYKLKKVLTISAINLFNFKLRFQQ